MKIKLGYLVTNLKACGPIHILKGIVQNLDNQIFESVIFTFTDKNSEVISNQLMECGSRIISLNCSRYSSIRQLRSSLRQELEKMDLDLIHSHGFRPDIICSGLMNEIKWISTLHNYPAYDYPLNYKFPIGQWMAWKHQKLIRQMPNPIACSQYLSSKLLNLNKETRAIQNGIIDSLFKPVSQSVKSNLRKAFQIKLRSQVFIYTGALIKRKNNELIIKAFNTLADLPVSLIFLGEGQQRDRLTGMSENNNIKFLDFRDNVHEYLQAADVFISASRYEGLPNSVMEAMSSGLVCLLSDIEPHRELTGDLPGNYFFRDWEQLSEQIRTLQQLDIESYRPGQQNHIKRHFSASVMSKKYQDLYRELING